MKKMVMMCAMVAAALCARAALPDGGPYTEVVDGIEWTFMVTNGEASVGAGFFLPAVSPETEGAIVIPGTLGGRVVTSIGSLAFRECIGLTSVTIPKTVMSIESSAFVGCEGLGDGITVVDDCLVQVGYAESPESYTVPKGVRLIADATFSQCRTLRDITLPSSLTHIGKRAFAACSGLTCVTIPASVKSIDFRAFTQCTGLTSIAIPASVTSIGELVFEGCRSLSQISVDNGNPAYAVKNQLLCTKDGLRVVDCPGAIRDVAIPKSVKSIGTGVFSHNSLESIAVEAGNKYFSVQNQLLCDKDGDTVIACPCMLGRVEIPSTVITIGERSFAGCGRLQSLTIPAQVKDIGMYAFEYCTSLESITLRPGVTKFGDCLFEGCVSLREVAIPDGVTQVDTLAFCDCRSLSQVMIPKSLTQLSSSAFTTCTALRIVHVEPGDANRVRRMLRDCRIMDTYVLDQAEVVEDYEPEPGPVPPGPEPEPEEGFEEAHTFNGLAYAGEVMCGIIQVTTSKRTAKDQVKVGGFVMLTDGKKQTIKSVTEDIEGGKVYVETKAGKLGEMELEITDNGFTGSVGLMTVKSGDVGEDTGIISGTLKMSYFDAKTNKLKTRSIKLGGVASGGEAAGTLTTKGEDTKVFEAVIE